MSHWQSVQITKFRRLRDLRLDGLGRVNVLVGRNNSGKTTVLEALAILCNPADPWTWLDIARQREIKSARTPAAEILKQFFPHFRQMQEEGHFDSGVSIEATGEKGRIGAGAQFVEFRYEPPANGEVADAADEPRTAVRFQLGCTVYDEKVQRIYEFYPDRDFNPSLPPMPRGYPWQMISPVTHRTDHNVLENVSRAIELGAKQELIQLLRPLEPDLEEIEILSPAGRSAVVKLCLKETGFVPLSAEGDGVRRALALVTSAYFAKDGLLFLDEIETALHSAGVEGVVRTLVRACMKLNVQVFATTHSLEAVDAVVAAMEENIDDLVLYRLPLSDDGAVKRFDGAQARRIRHEEGFDLR